MKHIFLIHSHITRDMAWAIIRRERIALDDAVFLWDRKFETKEEGVRVVDLNLPDEHFLIYKNPFRGWRNLLEIGRFIDDLSPVDFICYLPHTYSDFANLMVNHSRCSGYNLMEEGMGSYCSVEEINLVVPPCILGWRQRLLSQFLYMGRFKDRRFFRRDYIAVYGTSEQAFPGFDRKVVVDLFSESTGSGAHRSAPSVFKVIVLESVVETRVVTEEEFMFGFDQMLKLLKSRLNEGDVVYIKRHPYQYVKPEFSDRLIAHLRERVPAHEVRELGGDVSLEKMALNGGAEFYLSVSSVSIYASRLGSKVYSYARSIGRSSPEFMRSLEQAPQVFHDSVEFI